MLSRGKILVSMALKAKQNVIVNTNVKYKIQGSDMQCIKSKPDIADYNNNEVAACTSQQPELETSNVVAEMNPDDAESEHSCVDIDINSCAQFRTHDPLMHNTTNTLSPGSQNAESELVVTSHVIADGSELATSDTDLNFDIDQYEDRMVEEADNDDDVRDPTYIPECSSTSDSDEHDNDQIQIDHEEIVEDRGPGRKRTRTDGTQRSKNKKLRMHGKAYKGMKKIDERWGHCVERGERILCPRNCSKRCDKSSFRFCSHISEDERKEVFDKFLGTMNWDERKVYVNSLVGSGATTVKTVADSRRSRSYKYFLWKNNDRVQVCKNMFLTTLGIGEQSVYRWCQNAPNGIPSKQDNLGTRKAEQLKRHEALRTGVRRFLEEIPKLESHYCRASSSKLYLEPIFDSLSTLYKEYKNYCKSNNIRVAHRKVFETLFSEMNLSLFTPKKDQCDICCGHDSGNIQEEDYQAHIQRKNAARAEKERDKETAKQDPSQKVVTMDLQSVLLCPKLNASALYYKTKLACHNFTIMDLNSKQVQCYFWHESQGDLSSNSFASCIAHYIESTITNNNEVKHFIIYSDGCTYQNRNCVLANTLCHICRKYQVQVTQKYLERGHTQMEVDSVHSVIECKLKRKNIYVPQNYVEVIREACSVHPYLVYYVDHTFFKQYSDLSYYSTIRPGTKVGDPVVTNIRAIHYSPSGDVTIKLMFEDDFSELPRRARLSDVQCEDPPQLHSGQLAIKRSKFQHLMELKSVIPVDYHTFFDNLIHE